MKSDSIMFVSLNNEFQIAKLKTEDDKKLQTFNSLLICLFNNFLYIFFILTFS